MRRLKSTAKNILRKIIAQVTLTKLGELHAMRHPAASRIADALRDTCSNRLLSEERAWVSKIEAVRRQLAASKTEIAVLDYGSGTAGEARPTDVGGAPTECVFSVAQACRASKPCFWGIFLLKLLRAFRPTRCIELGTCVGISAAYQAAALQLNGEGRLVTIEGSPSLVSIARTNLATLGLDNVEVVAGPFCDHLETQLGQLGQVDYAYIDGHHDEAATIKYFETMLPYLSDLALVVFDDISWSPGMRRAWSQVQENPNVRIAVDLGTVGLCVLDRDSTDHHRFRSHII